MDTAIKNSIALDAGGYVRMPQKPGPGLEIDRDRKDELTTAVL